jgi:hypothetical protein
MLSPNLIITDSSLTTSVWFDTSDRGHREALERLRTLSREHGRIESLDQRLFVFYVSPVA